MNDNSWHEAMYDKVFATKTIGSKSWAKKAEREVDFILRILALRPGADLLDLPCGTGRHSVQFARRGLLVTGVDINSICIDLANKQSRHRNVKYMTGDISKLRKFYGKFDVVTNLNTSFGYFATDHENKLALKGMICCLKQGGRIVIHTVNRNFAVKTHRPAVWGVDGKLTTVQATVYDSATKYTESYICIVDNKKGLGTARYHRLRLYSPDEMIQLMKACGCKAVRVWGDFDGNPLDKKTSMQPIYVGTRG